jgi:predicted nuclease with TOPRIM domain
MTDMESRLRQRLGELRAEYDKGQNALQDLESQAANLRATLLRISGAVQVLQEALGEAEAGSGAPQRLAPPA